MKITNAQKKLIENLYGKGDFLEVDDILYYKVSNDNTTYRVDFDKTVYNKRMDGVEQNSKDTTDNKKKIEESDEKQVQDLTPEQVQENYWVETPETEIDGSFAMYETRIAKEMESKDSKDRERAKSEVKQKLAQKGVSVINTEDLTEDGDRKTVPKKAVKRINKALGNGGITRKTKKEEEDLEDGEEEKDMADLIEENEQLKKDLVEAEKTNEEMKTDFKETMDFVEKIKKEREAELETKRQEKIKQIVTDFVGMTEEELKDDTMEELEKTERRLVSALKKDTPEEEEAKTTDMQTHIDLIEAKAQALSKRYECDL